jgi:hypothetical protein
MTVNWIYKKHNGEIWLLFVGKLLEAKQRKTTGEQN